MAEAMDERDVFTAVYRDMAEREVVGWQNHGKPLLADDGRDWLQEAYEECLDMAVYLKAQLMQPRYLRVGEELTPARKAAIEDAFRNAVATPAPFPLFPSVMTVTEEPRRPWWRWWR